MDKTSVSDFSLSGYDKYEPDSQGDRGVILFVKSGINVNKISILNDSFKESVWCEMTLNGTDKLLIGLVYRSPTSSHRNNDDLIVTVNRAIALNYSHYLLIGDFNYKEIDWINLESTVGDLHPATKVFNCTQDNFLFQHVRTPTRFREGQNPSCLDLILTNEENMIDTESLSVDSPLGKSDHAIISFDYLCYFNISNDNSEKYQYFKGDYISICKELDEENWDILFNNKEVDEMWTIFKSKLFTSMDKHIPKKRPDNKFFNPPLWMNRQTKSAVLKKRRAWKRYHYARSDVSYRNYALKRNQCSNIIRNAKKSYERKIALEVKSNCKSFWKYVNSKLKTRQGIGNLLKSDGSLTINDTEKAEVLNNFFSSVFTRTEDLN